MERGTAANTRKAIGRANELASIREVVNVYGDLLKEASHRQFAEACRHTNANVSRILRNKAKMHQAGECVFERKAA